MKISVALSGGGIRATIYHLGVFKYLAERGLLGQITHISSVSGASLCVALIFARNGNKWPSDDEYLHKVLPDIEKTVLANDIQNGALVRLPFSPSYWSNKAALIAKMLEKKWGVTGSLRDLPDNPVWHINTTTFETGADFCFSKEKLGDYQIGYYEKPDFPISQAAAASAGFPILIGPLKFDCDIYPLKGGREEARQTDNILYLWDGGVYDNLGLEPLYSPDKGLGKSDADFLVLSNAGKTSGIKEHSGWNSAGNLMRLLNIAMDQVTSLRMRDVFHAVFRDNKGILVNIGKSAEEIVSGSSLLDVGEKQKLIAECLSPGEAATVRDYPTILNSPTEENYNLLLRHGYENALCCWKAYIDNVRCKVFRENIIK